MKRNDPIRKLMSTELVTVRVDQKISDVRRMLSENQIHHVPVMSGKEIVGLISATDMVKMSLSAFGADERAVDAMLDSEFTIRGVMTKQLNVLGAGRTVRDAAEMLSGGTFHSLPIVEQDNELVGIVTSTDIIRYLLDQY